MIDESVRYWNYATVLGIKLLYSVLLADKSGHYCSHVLKLFIASVFHVTTCLRILFYWNVI